MVGERPKVGPARLSRHPTDQALLNFYALLSKPLK
jgi:hypothetical protein